MAPKLPDRYQTHVRLGRDGDVEEWLATDTSLDRPVLVRVLDATSSAARRVEYQARVRAAAAAHHSHLAEVYAVGEAGQAYAVTEWHGGVTIADRVHARQPLAVDDFLPNAVGLASGLAELHSAGAVHGSIDPTAIGYGAGQPAKLGAFGRSTASEPTPDRDTRDLAATLRTSIVGDHDEGIGPSQVAEGIPPGVDAVLAEAEAGKLNAARLAASLRAIPAVPVPTGIRWSWGWVGVVIAIVIAGLAISAAGIAFEFDEESPVLFPAAPAATSTVVTTTAPISAPESASENEMDTTPLVFDPFGDESERDDELVLMSDGDPTTGWRTETYFRPLDEIKDGVGVVFSLPADPAAVVIQGTPGIEYEWKWNRTVPDDFAEWEHINRGTLLAGQNDLQLPQRSGGRWLLWLTGLPESGDGEYVGEITVVRFVR